MSLAETTVVVQFAEGIESKRDKKGVLPTKMLALENAVFSKAISFVKRGGYEDLGSVILGSGATLPNPIALGRRQFELLAFTGDEAYSFIDENSAWARAGDVLSVICDHEPIAKTGSDQTLADVAVLGGVALYGWEDSRGGVWYALQNDYTGRSLVPPTLVHAGAQRPRCHAVGDFLHLYWVLGAAGEIRVWRIDPNTPLSSPVETILITDIDGAAPHYDVDTDDEKAVIAWRTTAATIGVGYVHQSGALGGAGLGLPIPATVAESPTQCLGVALDKTNDVDEGVGLAWSDASATFYTVLESALGAEFAGRTVAAVPSARVTCVFQPDTHGGSQHNELWVSSEDQGASHRVRHLVASPSVDEFVVVSQRDQLGLVLGGKAFIDDGVAYVITMRDSTLYRTYFVQRISDGLVVARWLPGVAGGRLTKAHLPSVSEEATRAVRFAAIYVTDVEAPDGSVFSEKGIRRVSLDFLSDDAFRSVQLGRTTYVNGGLPQAYDGQRVQESGFHYGPDDIATPVVTGPASVGPGLATGVYGYVIAYENPLANGEMERGPTSPLVTVTVASDGRAVQVTIPTYRWPSKPGMRIGVFRSQNGDAAVLSRVSSLNPSDTGPNGFLANDPTVDTVTFVDEMDDLTLTSRDPLYTNGGIVINDPIGAVRLIAGGKGRIFAVDSSQPNRVYHSQEQADGFAAEFSPELFFDVDPFGGDINGIIVMDDAVIVFKETAIFLVEGPGPLANPDVGGGFSQPQLVTSDVGCSSPDSLGYTPLGVMFQSQKGIFMLGRDRSVGYVGRAVEAYNAQRVVATSLIEDRTQIRFLTDAGRTLLYDYAAIGNDGLGQWSTFTNHEGQDAIVVDGEYFYLRNDGRVVTETPTDYRDVNSQIRMAMETAWLKLAGHLQGWQFLWFVTVVGEWVSDHRLRVYTAFDYEEGWSGPPIEVDPLESRQTAPYGGGAYGAGPYGGFNDTRYQFEIHVGAECEAVRFRFEDVEPTGSFGASFELTELILTGGVQRSTYGVEEARRY